MTLLRLKYRLRYYWRKFQIFIERCPDCGNHLLTTRCGNHHCSWCGTMKR